MSIQPWKTGRSMWSVTGVALLSMYLVSYVTDAKTCLRGSSQLQALHSLDGSDNVSVTVLHFFFGLASTRLEWFVITSMSCGWRCVESSLPSVTHHLSSSFTSVLPSRRQDLETERRPWQQFWMFFWRSAASLPCGSWPDRGRGEGTSKPNRWMITAILNTKGME